MGLLEVLGRVGNVLDLPGSSLRDALMGEDPWDQWGSMTTDENRSTGRDLLRSIGLAGEEDTTANAIGGMLAEMLVDPLNLIGGALLGRKAFQRSRATKVASRKDLERLNRGFERRLPGKSTGESRRALEEHLIEEFGWEPTTMDWRGPSDPTGLSGIRKGPLGVKIKGYPSPSSVLPDDIVELAMVASDETARGGVGQSMKIDRAMSELVEAADDLGISMHGDPVSQNIGLTGKLLQDRLEDWYEGFGMYEKEWLSSLSNAGERSHLGLWDELTTWARKPGSAGKYPKLTAMRKRKWKRPPPKDFFADVPHLSPLIKALLAERLINKGLNQFPVLADKGGMSRSHPYAPMDAIEGMDDETRLLYEEHYEDPLY
jgi:hypothetical protein